VVGEWSWHEGQDLPDRDLVGAGVEREGWRGRTLRIRLDLDLEDRSDPVGHRPTVLRYVTRGQNDHQGSHHRKSKEDRDRTSGNDPATVGRPMQDVKGTG